MEPYRCYCDLINEIELLECQFDICIKERREWSFYGRLGSAVRMNQAAERLDKLAKQIEFISEQLVQKKKYQKHKLSQFKSIEYKVAYMRGVENKALQEIADELHYSIDQIKKISAKVTSALLMH